MCAFARTARHQRRATATHKARPGQMRVGARPPQGGRLLRRWRDRGFVAGQWMQLPRRPAAGPLGPLSTQVGFGAQAMPTPRCSCKICEPHILHRPRGPQSPHDAAASATCSWPWFLCAPWPIGHGARRNQGQPRVTQATVPCGASGPLKPPFLAHRLSLVI